jgi:hypothetical protein
METRSLAIGLVAVVAAFAAAFGLAKSGGSKTENAGAGVKAQSINVTAPAAVAGVEVGGTLPALKAERKAKAKKKPSASSNTSASTNNASSNTSTTEQNTSQQNTTQQNTTQQNTTQQSTPPASNNQQNTSKPKAEEPISSSGDDG